MENIVINSDDDVISLLGNVRNKKVIYETNKSLQKYLKCRYTDIPEDMFTYKEVYWRIYKHIDIRPVCWCGKPVQFVGSEYNDKIGKTVNGYRKTCCQEHKYTQDSVSKAYNTKKRIYGEKLQKITEKREYTCLSIYGVTNVSQTQFVQDKIKKTNKEKYGCDYALQNKEIREKIKETNNVRYGCDNVFQSDVVKNVIRNSCNQKYGKDNYMKSNYGRKQMSEIMSNNDVIQRRKDTCLEKYGVEHVLSVDYIQEKRYQTLKKNKTGCISKEETYLYKLLCELFGEHDIKQQYKSDEYPFACDFYVISKRLYIEYHGSYYHQGHPFNERDEDDLMKLDNLYQKGRKSVIYTWTDLDVRKRNISEENNINILFLYPDFCKDWKHYCRTINRFGNDVDNVKNVIIKYLKKLIYEKVVEIV